MHTYTLSKLLSIRFKRKHLDLYNLSLTLFFNNQYTILEILF